MKLNLKSLAALVALALGGTAHAAIDMPNSAQGGELFLTVYDNTVGHEASYILGLNINTTTFNGNGSYNFGSLFSDPNFTSVFGSAQFAEQSAWKWNVVAGNAGNSWGDSESVFFTEAAQSVAMDNGTANQGATYVINFQTSNLAGSTNDFYASNNPVQAKYAGGKNWGSILGGGLPAQNTSGALNSALNFYSAHNTTLDSGYELGAGDPATVVKYAGLWSLSSTGNLTYSATPIPAALWLLGSGLMGLVGIGRRKAA